MVVCKDDGTVAWLMGKGYLRSSGRGGELKRWAWIVLIWRSAGGSGQDPRPGKQAKPWGSD